VFALATSGHQPSGAASPVGAATASIRYDGVYRDQQPDYTWYLRFFPSGTVVWDKRQASSASSNSPSKATLTESSNYGKGTFATDNKDIKFQIRTGNSEVDFDGAITGYRTFSLAG
jgi:hypothetical protein